MGSRIIQEIGQGIKAMLAHKAKAEKSKHLPVTSLIASLTNKSLTLNDGGKKKQQLQRKFKQLSLKDS